MVYILKSPCTVHTTTWRNIAMRHRPRTRHASRNATQREDALGHSGVSRVGVDTKDALRRRPREHSTEKSHPARHRAPGRLEFFILSRAAKEGLASPGTSGPRPRRRRSARRQKYQRAAGGGRDATKKRGLCHVAYFRTRRRVVGARCAREERAVSSRVARAIGVDARDEDREVARRRLVRPDGDRCAANRKRKKKAMLMAHTSRVGGKAKVGALAQLEKMLENSPGRLFFIIQNFCLYQDTV